MVGKQITLAVTAIHRIVVIIVHSVEITANE